MEESAATKAVRAKAVAVAAKYDAIDADLKVQLVGLKKLIKEAEAARAAEAMTVQAECRANKHAGGWTNSAFYAGCTICGYADWS